MTQPSLADLFSKSTIAEIFNLGIAVARKALVPVDTWQPGDPTRSLYQFLSEYLGGAFEPIAERYTAVGFLTFARALAEIDPGAYPWLVRQVFEVYGYITDEATFATVRMTLTNNEGALYTEADLAAGNVSYQNTLTGATYTATSGPVVGVRRVRKCCVLQGSPGCPPPGDTSNGGPARAPWGCRPTAAVIGRGGRLSRSLISRKGACQPPKGWQCVPLTPAPPFQV